MGGHSTSLKIILDQLENPNVRLQDSSEYKLSESEIGRLYVCFVSTAPTSISPGKARKKYELLPEAVQEFEKRFQHATRDFFYEILGKVELRELTRENINGQYFPADMEPENYAENSLERLMAITPHRSFAEVGKAVKFGAASYYDVNLKRGMDNYRICKEYAAILEALKNPSGC